MREFIAEPRKTVLSSETRTYKTARFMKETARFRDIDLFAEKLAEGVIANPDIFKTDKSAPDKKSIVAFKLCTEDRRHGFWFAFGGAAGSEKYGISDKDIVFFKYESTEENARKNDSSLSVLLSEDAFFILAENTCTVFDAQDFRKLYRLSHSDTVNFPLLNAEQRKIVTTEDQNVLVQGVAGSGKTNVCIEKLVFTACRGYKGRVLYSTFSRGLLIDTQTRVTLFQNNLRQFVKDYEEGRVVFADADKRKAIENKIGVYFTVNDDDKLCDKIKSVINFLDNNIDYFLIEDLYLKYAGGGDTTVTDENFFVKTYVKDIKNHQLAGKLEKVAYLSYEVIYKEIFGVIFGCYDLSAPAQMLSQAEYSERRRDSFTVPECEVIYSLAKDYDAYMSKNGLTDNNRMSRNLLDLKSNIETYSLAILDEVQDMTEVNLCLFKSIARKLFCVGDALQMINPSYFGFAYLKRLLFEKDVVSVAELSNNYRNTKRIADIVGKLGELNTRRFGTHSFVLRSVGVEGDATATAIYVHDKRFIKEANELAFNNYTVIVPGEKERGDLRKFMKKQEILTVAEIKGLERESVILYNLLSANADKWSALARMQVNRKQADENSVYRYYFNLFYVGVSRAKTHVYVAEDNAPPEFGGFFRDCFEAADTERAISSLIGTTNKAEIEQDELLERVEQFLKLDQFDNARFAANRVTDLKERERALTKIDIYEQLIRHGKHREAGIRFWEAGMPEEAKEQFVLSKDTVLCDLIDACSGKDSDGLNLDVLDFFPEVAGNETARKVIVRLVNKDLKDLTEGQRALDAKFKGRLNRGVGNP
ncbi:MAG: UvrD-helicase domain-containing protein [Clostridiaceae bacterium]|jgi:hypothetical protein|nr:UvrD-helicase domain-containing protein [Clostridiaceae bacterium]